MLENELQRKRDLIEDLGKEVNKITFLLSEWVQDYGFCDKPDPRAAIGWVNGKREDIEGKNAAAWFWEYDRIYQLVDMSFDIAQSIEEKIEKEKEMR